MFYFEDNKYMLSKNRNHSISASIKLNLIYLHLVSLFAAFLLVTTDLNAQEIGQLDTVVFLSQQSQVLSLNDLQKRKGLVSLGPRPSARTLIYLEGLFGVELTDGSIERILAGLRQIYNDDDRSDIRISAARPYFGSNALQIVLNDRIFPQVLIQNTGEQNRQTTSRTLEDLVAEMARARRPANPDEAPVLESDPPASSIQAILLISDTAFYDLDRSFEHSGVAEFGARPPAGLLSDLERFVGTNGAASIDQIFQMTKEAYGAVGQGDLEIWVDPNLPPSGNVKILIGPKQADMATTIPKERKESSAAPQPWVLGTIVVMGMNGQDAEETIKGITLISGEPIDRSMLQNNLDELNRSPNRTFRISYQPVSLTPPVLDVNVIVSARQAPNQQIFDLPVAQQQQAEPDTFVSSHPQPPVYRLGQYRVVGADRSGDSNIINRMTVLPGEYIDRDVLRRDLYALNKSPHRTVQMAFEQVAEDHELLDVVLTVSEAKAVRFFGSIDNSGLDRSGEYPIDFGLEWNKLGLWDQTMSYKFNSDTELEGNFGHTLRYSVISQLGHQFDATGQFSESVSETIVPPSIIFSQLQRSAELSGKYTVPLVIKENGLTVETYFGFTAKDRVFETTADGVPESRLHNRIYQFTPGFIVSHSGEVFAYSLDGKLTLSPGGIGSLNSDAAFQAERVGTRSDYLYGNLNLTFSYNFQPEWALKGRFTGQISSARLLSSEKLSAGGNETVRGFDSGAGSGDYGAVASVEVHLPTFDLPNVSMNIHSLQPFLFIDGAVLGNRNALPTEGSPQLLSVGAGFNYNLGEHAHIAGNYGWQLIDENTGDLNDSRFILRAAFNF